MPTRLAISGGPDAVRVRLEDRDEPEQPRQAVALGRVPVVVMGHGSRRIDDDGVAAFGRGQLDVHRGLDRVVARSRWPRRSRRRRPARAGRRGRPSSRAGRASGGGRRRRPASWTCGKAARNVVPSTATPQCRARAPSMTSTPRSSAVARLAGGQRGRRAPGGRASAGPDRSGAAPAQAGPAPGPRHRAPIRAAPTRPSWRSVATYAPHRKSVAVADAGEVDRADRPQVDDAIEGLAERRRRPGGERAVAERRLGPSGRSVRSATTSATRLADRRCVGERRAREDRRGRAP